MKRTSVVENGFKNSLVSQACFWVALLAPLPSVAGWVMEKISLLLGNKQLSERETNCSSRSPFANLWRGKNGCVSQYRLERAGSLSRERAKLKRKGATPFRARQRSCGPRKRRRALRRSVLTRNSRYKSRVRLAGQARERHDRHAYFKLGATRKKRGRQMTKAIIENWGQETPGRPGLLSSRFLTI